MLPHKRNASIRPPKEVLGKWIFSDLRVTDPPLHFPPEKDEEKWPKKLQKNGKRKRTLWSAISPREYREKERDRGGKVRYRPGTLGVRVAEGGCTSFCLRHSAFSQTAFAKLPWRHTAFGTYCIEDKLPFCHMTFGTKNLRTNYILVNLSSVHIAFEEEKEVEKAALLL